MKREDLPPHIRRFILTSIPSVPYLEAILLLRATPGKRWTPGDLAARLYVPEAAAAELLQGIASAGVAAGDADAFAYRPATAELAGLIDEVASVYSSNLLAVTDLVHSRIDRRAQQFADAFRWRKDS